MSLTAEEIRECTMIALDQPPFWPEPDDSFRFTITVDGTNDRPMTVSFPNGALYSFFNGFGGIIDWGDGYKEETEHYFFSSMSHTYLSTGTYQIKLKGHFQYQVNGGGGSNSHPMLSYQKQLDSIDSKFPIAEYAYRRYIDGKPHWEWQPILPDHIIYIDGLFGGCINLKKVPLGLFKNIPKTNFGRNVRRLFYRCQSLQEIPYDLFEYFENIYGDVIDCFFQCESIRQIPEKLFDHFELVTSFQRCFQGCLSLEFIPENLFRNINRLKFGCKEKILL